MESLLFSLGRRRIDRRTLEVFEGTLRYHGALGYRDRSVSGPTTESARLKAVPLVFGLLPIDSIVRQGHDQLVKPSIRTHLAKIGVPPDESLVEVLKAVADQLWSTWPINNKFGNMRRRSKASMASLRANPSLYKQIRTMQGERCAVCGVSFESPGEETLDHTVPFRLIGDAADGANWQILCQACNLGKAERFSALQSVEALNWIYRDASGNYVRIPSLQTRYVVLAQTGACEHSECGATPRSAALLVQRILLTGLWVADNISVRCLEHASNDGQGSPLLHIETK
jgi:hypothetical protein